MFDAQISAPSKVNGDGLEERPEMTLEGGARYGGQWKGEVWHGTGTLVRPDGSRYQGSFQDGAAHGAGCFVASNGNSYQGQWEKESGGQRWRTTKAIRTGTVLKILQRHTKTPLLSLRRLLAHV